MRFAQMAEPYLRLRWPVFPVSKEKRPFTSHGYKDASTDPRKIDEWSRRFPDANIAIATGKISGLIVIDVDGSSGEETLSNLAEAGIVLTSPLQVSTGRGRHLYFKDDRTMRSSAGKLGPGLDIRAGGGSIIAPPSLHQKGNRYEWLADPEKTPLPHLPMALLLYLYKPKGKPSYGSAPLISMTEVVSRLGSAQPGTRNQELNTAAYLAGKAIRSGQIGWDEAEKALIDAGLGIGLDRSECVATVRSGLRAGQEA